MSSHQLEVHDLTVRYGAVTAVDRVSLHVDAGEVVTILGPNGAGKTSLLRGITGAVKTRGRVVFEGQEIAGKRPDQILRIGISHVLEGRHILPSLTVRENLLVGTTIRKDDFKPDLDRLFEGFPVLAERRNSLGTQLSGGQQQMLAIARGLLSRPKLIIFDEPSLGLAPVAVDSLMEIIEWVCKEFGTSLLLVEQNAEVALALAKRGYVMVSGRLIVEESASEISQEILHMAYLGGSPSENKETGHGSVAV